jgi:hypothetical protein
MTALSDYQRLESTGVWRPTPKAQRRDVVVALGEATLVLTDQKDTALAHWSLAAVERRNPGEMPAVFAPGADATEELELADAEMIAAIERVRRAVVRSRPAPGRLRTRVGLAAAALIVLGGAVLIPDALIRQAARVAPPAARAEIGVRTRRAHVERIAGPPCASPAGDRALRRLETRLLGPDGGRIVVVGDGLDHGDPCAGGDDPPVAPACRELRDARGRGGLHPGRTGGRAQSDPLLRLLDRTGTGAAFSLLTTGQVPDDKLQDYAEYLLATGSVAVPEDGLLAAFGEARVRSTPYAYAQDMTGEETVTLIEADPVPPDRAMTILTDGDWVALQGICGG